MKDYSTVIIEDEKPAARLLMRKLNDLGLVDVEMLHSVAQARKWFSENACPDLIFLDIQLSDGLSFEIFDGNDINSSIIFTTAYDEFALKAFKMNSIDYLLKPISQDELSFAIDKFERLRDDRQELNLKQIKEIFNNSHTNFKNRFTVKVGQNIKLINIEDIECFYSENKGTYIFTKDGDQYLLDYSLDQIEGLLHPERFFRISRSHLINISAIKNISIHSNSRLRIELFHYPSKDVIVSRERVQDFKTWLG